MPPPSSRLARLHKAAFAGEDDGLDPVARAKLAEDVGDVGPPGRLQHPSLADSYILFGAGRGARR